MINGLGERLQEQRNKLHMSQREVAKVIGVSPSIVSNYESSERTPSTEKLIALSNLYRCSADYLLGIEKKKRVIDCSMLSEKQIDFLQSFLNEFE